MQNSKFIIFLIVVLMLALNSNAALMNHTASDIAPNTAGQGDFAFQRTGELFVGIRNTETSGRYWALVSAGNVGGIGVGKFSIYDKTADSSRLTIDANGYVGIGTTTPKTTLHVVGNINATGDICTDAGGGKCLSSGSSQNAHVEGNITFGTGIGVVLGHVKGKNPQCPAGYGTLMKKWNGNLSCRECGAGSGWSVGAPSCQSCSLGGDPYGNYCDTCTVYTWTEIICIGN